MDGVFFFTKTHYRNQIPEKHLAKVLPRVTLDKESSANSTSATTFLASTFYRALGKTSQGIRQGKVAVTAADNGDGAFAECTRWHSTKNIQLPSVLGDTQQRVSLFTECPLD